VKRSAGGEIAGEAAGETAAAMPEAPQQCVTTAILSTPQDRAHETAAGEIFQEALLVESRGDAYTMRAGHDVRHDFYPPKVSKATPPGIVPYDLGQTSKYRKERPHFFPPKVPKAAPSGIVPYDLGPYPRSATASSCRAPAPGPKAPSGPPPKSKAAPKKKKVPAWEPHHKANPLLGNTVVNSTTWKQNLDSKATACDGEKVQKQVQQIRILRQFLDNEFEGLEQRIQIFEWADEDSKEWTSTVFEGACIQMKMRMNDALQEMSERIQNIAKCIEEKHFIKSSVDYYVEE
jgi:hypothetical protein